MKMLVENDDDKEAEDVIYFIKVGNAGRNNAGNQEIKSQITKGRTRQINRSQGARTEKQTNPTKRRNRRHA